MGPERSRMGFFDEAGGADKQTGKIVIDELFGDMFPKKKGEDGRGSVYQKYTDSLATQEQQDFLVKTPNTSKTPNHYETARKGLSGRHIDISDMLERDVVLGREKIHFQEKAPWEAEYSMDTKHEEALSRSQYSFNSEEKIRHAIKEKTKRPIPMLIKPPLRRRVPGKRIVYNSMTQEELDAHLEEIENINYVEITVVEMKDYLRKLAVKSSGKKEVLEERLKRCVEFIRKGKLSGM
ncbi:MAG: uncharacterized protein A8A55_1734 [Amphiamblys sp. WSBS2006]|nr:MAG: uncharacterized protein A8A55_1734 [Amphiamblys sp. WSBS2006]